MMRLYTYWRSSAAYRVRIALNLKGVAYVPLPVDLVAGEQRRQDYLQANPAGLVPSLVLEDGTVLTQSLAIIDWLDAAYPEPALLPAQSKLRAKVLAMAHAIASDIHPINNLRVTTELEARFGAPPEAKADWMRHWMAVGFAALEGAVSRDTIFAFTDRPTLAEICLAAQLYNARRWALDLTPYPRLVDIDAAAQRLPAFAQAAPEVQPDAQPK